MYFMYAAIIIRTSNVPARQPGTFTRGQRARAWRAANMPATPKVMMTGKIPAAYTPDLCMHASNAEGDDDRKNPFITVFANY